jgi:lipopolysaccharide export system permease protein
MPTHELLQEISVRGEGELPTIRTEIQKRYSMGLSCVAFVLIGVPLGILLKKGHTLSAFAVSCLPVFLLYYPLLMVGQSLGTDGKLNPVVAMWLPNILLAAAGGLLFAWLLKR